MNIMKSIVASPILRKSDRILIADTVQHKKHFVQVLMLYILSFALYVIHLIVSN